MFSAIRASLTFRCTACLALYAAALILLFSTVNMMTESKLNEAFPTMDVVIKHEDALADDRFDELSRTVPKSCDLLVFSQGGERLYASSAAAAERVTAADLPIISSSSDDHLFYEVLEREDALGQPVYEILLCAHDGNSLAKTVRAWAICTEDGDIVDGTLFPDRASLTERELSLIRGVYGERKTIQKHEYETSGGEGRTVVLISPVVSETTYDAIVAQAKNTWLWAIPVVLIATVAAVAALAFIVRRAVRPLDQAIDARKHPGSAQGEQAPLPIELAPTYDNFIDLMDQLDNAQEEKQRIIADVSHDLKTPLTVISGYTQAFEDGRVPDDKRDEYLHAIHERAQAATQLIEELFTYAKSEHPSFQPVLADCDVHEQLRQLLVRRQPDIEHAGDELEVDIPEEPFTMQLDWDLMGRAVNNLITNACKHNPSGTHIRVSCTHDASTMGIAVSDTGTGIPDELKETAFEPFVTSNDSRSLGEGTGLGLSIVRSCAIAHGGVARFAETAAPYKTSIVIEIPRHQRGDR